MHLEWSRNCVKLTRDAAGILAFAEEVSLWVICVAADMMAFAMVRESCKVSRKRVKSKCLTKSVKSECLTKVSSQSVLQKHQMRVSHKTVKSGCPTYVFRKRVKSECPIKVSSQSVLQKHQMRASHYNCTGGVCVSDSGRRSYYGVLQRRCLCVCDLRRLQRRCLCERVSSQSVLQECEVRVYKRVKWERRTRVSRERVKWECPTRVSSNSVLQECLVRVSYKSVK